MSAGNTAAHVHVEVLHDHDAAAHGTLKSYVTGFVLSVILTAIPFWLVMRHVIVDSQTNALVIMGFGFVQIIVHMHYFLHMNTKSEGGWTFLALVFTVVMVVITLAGSIWVMYHMNGNMMPMKPADMGTMKM
ncbi:MAG: cytochrome o ubiquinol oxidase subunit IV [Janthinobacterium lividum]